MTENIKQQNCPSIEELEDLLYAREENSSSRHLENCLECRRKAEGLRRVDALLKLHMAPPEGLAERIKAAVHSGKKPVVQPFHWWNARLWRSAAAAASISIIAMAAALLLRGNAFKGSHGAYAANVEALLPAEEYILSDSLDKQEDTEDMKISLGYPETPYRAVNNGGVPMGENTGDLASKHFSQAKNTVPATVRHVWSVKNLPDAMNFITNIAIVNHKVLQWENDDVTKQKSPVISLSDRELQNLVDKLNANRWALLKPDLPQPGAADRVDFSGKTVLYKLCLVSE